MNNLCDGLEKNEWFVNIVLQRVEAIIMGDGAKFKIEVGGEPNSKQTARDALEFCNVFGDTETNSSKQTIFVTGTVDFRGFTEMVERLNDAGFEFIASINQYTTHDGHTSRGEHVINTGSYEMYKIPHEKSHDEEIVMNERTFNSLMEKADNLEQLQQAAQKYYNPEQIAVPKAPKKIISSEVARTV